MDALVQLDLRVHSHPGRTLGHGTVIADVLAARIRVPGNEHGARRIGRVVEAGRRDWYRQPVDTLSGLPERFARNDDFLARRVFNQDRLDLMAFGVIPLLLDGLDVAADAAAVDFTIGGQGPHRNRNAGAATGAGGPILQ